VKWPDWSGAGVPVIFHALNTETQLETISSL
jgi:hypothetical protein